MRRRDFLRRAGAVSPIGIGGLAGCTGDGGGTPTGLGETAVGMYTKGGAYYFDPIGLSVEPGETVTWMIRSGRHSTTAYATKNPLAGVRRIPDGAKAWDSDTLTARGATFEYTFDVEGTYDYFCVPHKSFGMVGRVVVGEPGGPAEGSAPPDGNVPESSAIVERGSISFSEFQG